MASLDIILNVEGTSDINALVNEVNRLEAYANKMLIVTGKHVIKLHYSFYFLGVQIRLC